MKETVSFGQQKSRDLGAAGGGALTKQQSEKLKKTQTTIHEKARATSGINNETSNVSDDTVNNEKEKDSDARSKDKGEDK